jgi:hypothetical protein
MTRQIEEDARNCAAPLVKIFNQNKLGDCWQNLSGWKSRLPCWELDYNAKHGGAKMISINEKGIKRDLFGSDRMKPAEFCKATSFAEKVLDLYRETPPE